MPDTTTALAPFNPYSDFTKGAAQANLAAAPELESLSKLINQINTQASQSRIPGGANLEALSSENIGRELSGNLPFDFINNLQTSIAQRGAGSGFGVDSGNLNASALRAMGLESIDMQDRGQRDLTAAIGRQSPIWNAAEGTMTPAQAQSSSEFGRTLANRQNEFNQQQNLGYETLYANQASDQARNQLGYSQIAANQASNQAQIEASSRELAAKMGLAYDQLDAQQQQHIDALAMVAAKANQQSDLDYFNSMIKAGYDYNPSGYDWGSDFGYDDYGYGNSFEGDSFDLSDYYGLW